MKVMKIKSDKVSIVQAHFQGSFLLVNPSIPNSIFLCWEVYNSYSHMTVLLEFESNYYIAH